MTVRCAKFCRDWIGRNEIGAGLLCYYDKKEPTGESSEELRFIQLLPLPFRPLADLEVFSLQRELRFFAIALGPITQFVTVPRRFDLSAIIARVVLPALGITRDKMGRSPVGAVVEARRRNRHRHQVQSFLSQLDPGIIRSWHGADVTVTGLTGWPARESTCRKFHLSRIACREHKYRDCPRSTNRDRHIVASSFGVDDLLEQKRAPLRLRQPAVLQAH